MSGIAEICDCGRRHHDEPASVLRAENPVGFWIIAPTGINEKAAETK